MPQGVLRLEGIELRATVGVQPAERLHPRTVELDIEWQGEVSPGSTPAVDYAAAAGELAARLGGAVFDYIEDIGCEALGILRASFPGGLWKVRVTKPCPPTEPRSARAVFEVSS